VTDIHRGFGGTADPAPLPDHRRSGAGSAKKTTVALAVAEKVSASYEDGRLVSSGWPRCPIRTWLASAPRHRAWSVSARAPTRYRDWPDGSEDKHALIVLDSLRTRDRRRGGGNRRGDPQSSGPRLHSGDQPGALAGRGRTACTASRRWSCLLAPMILHPRGRCSIPPSNCSTSAPWRSPTVSPCGTRMSLRSSRFATGLTAVPLALELAARAASACSVCQGGSPRGSTIASPS